MELAGHRVSVHLALWATTELYHFASQPVGRERCNGSTSLLTLGIGRPSRGWEMASHCGFDLHFPVTNDVKHLLMCSWAIHVSSYTKHLFKSSAHYFVRLFVFLFGCKNSLFCI